MTEKPMFTAWSVMDLERIPHRTDPDVCGITVDDFYREVTLVWGGCYPLKLDEINSPEDLLWILHHITKKTWGGMTPNKLGALIEIVAREKGWKLYDRVPHRNEAPKPNFSVASERAKMTPAMRYSVIKRDGYRCRACGFSVQDGAHLHVDHIAPVSKGGPTSMHNLQTLCTVCNLGKSDA